jgi:phage tail sheath protein FI
MATIGVATTFGSVGPSGTPDVAQGNAFFTGQTPWGIDGRWQLCSSFGTFVRLYGGLNKLVTVGSPDTWGVETTDAVVQCYYAVKNYFAEKGQNSPGVLYFSRAVASSSGPVAATKTFNDATTNATTVTAKGKGKAGNTITVQVINPSPKGSGWARIVVAFPFANITETYDIANAADAANASFKSELVTITLPSGGQLPVTAAATKLLSGSDGTTAYSASDADYVGTTTSAGARTGIQVFNDVKLGTGFIAVPGKYSSTVRAGINTHCDSYFRIGLMSAPTGLTASTVAADISGVASNRCVYYWPQLKVADENSDSGGVLLVANEGAMAGLACKMMRDYGGPHKSPAGITHPLVSITGLESQSSGLELVDDGIANTVADSGVNTIRLMGQPAGYVVWGNRTLATDRRYLQFNASQTINYIYHTCQLILQRYAFEPIDAQGHLYGKIRGDINIFLQSLFRAGALFGIEPQNEPRAGDAFMVVCDRTNNPDSIVNGNEVHVDVTFVAAPNAEKITLNLGPAAPGFAGKAQ